MVDFKLKKRCSCNKKMKKKNIVEKKKQKRESLFFKINREIKILKLALNIKSHVSELI